MRHSTSKLKDSGIFTIFVGGSWGGGGHNFWEIWRVVRGNLPLLRGEVLCNISPCETHFPPPPLLIIIAQSLIGKTIVLCFVPLCLDNFILVV